MHGRAAIILALVFLLQWFLLHSIATPVWDAAHYYAYGRSLAFDGDLDIGNDFALSYPAAAADFVARQPHADRTATGRVTSPFAIGSGLLWLPWLAVLRLGAVLVGLAGGLTGYEWPFVGGAATLSALLGGLAFWLAYRLAAVEAGRGAALVAAVTGMWATPLLYYQYREPLYAHAASAFTTTLVIYVWWRDARRGGAMKHHPALFPPHRLAPPVAHAGLLGGLIGLAALVRWQQLIYLALPVATAGWWWLWLPGAEKRRQLGPLIGRLAAVGVATAAVFSIQMGVWQLFYGSPLTLPQGSGFVDWGGRWVGPTLFSTYRGLLAWMPMVLPAVVGLVLLARRRPGVALPLLLVLALAVYVNGSTRDWFGGGGFGPRRFTGEVAILVWGYATLLAEIPRHWRGGAVGALGVGLAAHQWILLRYGLAERMGGRNYSMAPTFLWGEVTWETFGRQVAGHVADFWTRPAEVFVFGGSPLAVWLGGRWPMEHAATLLGAVVFLGVCWVAGRKFWPQISRIGADFFHR